MAIYCALYYVFISMHALYLLEDRLSESDYGVLHLEHQLPSHSSKTSKTNFYNLVYFKSVQVHSMFRNQG